jgi:hypothetical protein
MPLDVGEINLFEGGATVALVVFAFPWSLRWKPLLAPFETAKAPEPNPSGLWLLAAVFPGKVLGSIPRGCSRVLG